MVWFLAVPDYYANDDNANYFMGVYEHNWRSVVERGEVPLINFYQGLGNVHLGQGQTSVLYPMVYLSVWLSKLIFGSTQYGIDVSVLVHWMVGAVGMYWWLKWRRIDRWVAVLAGLAMISFPFVTGIGRSWMVMNYLIAWAPWVFWCFDGFMSQINPRVGSRWWLGMLGVNLVLVYQGYVQWVVMLVLVELIWFIVDYKEFGVKRTDKYLKGFSVWGLVGVLSLPVLWPLWVTTQKSVARAEPLPIGEWLRLTVWPIEWLKAQIGLFHEKAFYEGSSYVLFVGPVVVACLFWLFGNRKELQKKSSEWWIWFKVFAVVSLMSTVLYGAAYFVPIFNMFRWPFKWYGVAEILAVFSLVCGMQVSKVKNQRSKIFLVVIVVLNFGVMWINKSPSNAFSGHVLERPVNVDWLDMVDKKKGRVLSFGVNSLDYGDYEQLVGYNLASVFEANQVSVYDPTMSMELWKETRGIPAFGATPREFTTEMIEYMRGWGVRYYVTLDGTQAEELLAVSRQSSAAGVGDFGLEKIWDGLVGSPLGKDGVVVIEDKQALPLVYGVVGEQVVEVEYRFGVNNIEVVSPPVGELVFNVFWWPEYKARINGQPTDVHKVDNRPVINIDEETGVVELVFSYW